MTKTIQPPCKTIYRWLKDNLGPRCLGVLTGTDAKALSAAVQIVALWSYCSDEEVEKAFGLVVGRMQRDAQHLAFHSIAHVCDWSHRWQLWNAAGLDKENVIGRPGCKYGPETTHRPQLQSA